MSVYTTSVVDDEAHCMEVMRGMEDAFRRRDEEYFISVITREPSLVLRVHSVCILAELGGENSIPILADVLLNDPDPLVRHEAAFSLGQIGLSKANEALELVVIADDDAIVRHEAAAALGSIGSQSAGRTLRLALEDREEIVRNSAEASLFNLRFLRTSSRGSSPRRRARDPSPTS